MRVLVLTSTFPRWENDTTPPFVYELEKRLTNDHKIIVLAPHFIGANKFEVREKLKIYRFKYFWPTQMQKLCYEGGILPKIKQNKLYIVQAIGLIFFEMIAAGKIIRKEKIDLIHAHWIIPQGIVAIVMSKIFRIPYIVTMHGSDVYGLNNGILLWAKKQILLNASKITVVSNSLKKMIEDTLKIKLNIEVIPMGVDSKCFNPSRRSTRLREKFAKQGPLLLFIGRLEEIKGVKYVIQAMHKIVKISPNAKLLIIGNGPIINDLNKLIQKFSLQQNIEMLGAKPYETLPQYYASSDIFISPSITTSDGRNEGFGLTFVEASMSGCIPVGTKTGGITDIIVDGQTGIFVKEKNSESISSKVLEILSNKKLNKNLRKQSRLTSINKFDWKNISAKFNTLYASS